jgi:hypothetical protein
MSAENGAISIVLRNMSRLARQVLIMRAIRKQNLDSKYLEIKTHAVFGIIALEASQGFSGGNLLKTIIAVEEARAIAS